MQGVFLGWWQLPTLLWVIDQNSMSLDDQLITRGSLDRQLGTAVAIGRSLTEYVITVCRCLSLCCHFWAVSYSNANAASSRLLISCHELFRGHAGSGCHSKCMQ